MVSNNFFFFFRRVLKVLFLVFVSEIGLKVEDLGRTLTD